MREVLESGFKMTLLKDTSFRFEENQCYQNLSGMGLKEMDIGWWDDTNKRLIFLELKGKEIWKGFDKSKDKAHEHMVKSFKGKVTDVLLMMAAIWTGTDMGKALKTQLPKDVHHYPGEGRLKFIILVDTPAPRKPLLPPVKDAINRELAGRVRLFGVQYVTLVDFDKAVKIGIPVARDERNGTMPMDL